MNAILPPRLVRDKPRRDNRLRCIAHLRFVRTHACCVCYQRPTEAAHVRTGTNAGAGMKPSDIWTISLCARCHALQHAWGEAEFEKRFGIDMKALAEAFWAAFRKHNPAAARRAEQKVNR